MPNGVVTPFLKGDLKYKRAQKCALCFKIYPKLYAALYMLIFIACGASLPRALLSLSVV
jgi:hypothetical protein